MTHKIWVISSTSLLLKRSAVTPESGARISAGNELAKLTKPKNSAEPVSL